MINPNKHLHATEFKQPKRIVGLYVVIVLLALPAQGADPSPELQALYRKRDDIKEQLKQEMQRLQQYLAYETQIVGTLVASRTLSAEDGTSTLMRIADRLMRQSYQAQDLQQLRQRHQAQVRQFIASMPVENAKWPTNKARREYERQARQEQEQLQKAMSQPSSLSVKTLAPLLRRAAEVWAWSNASLSLAPENDFFSEGNHRIATALAQAHQNLRTTEISAPVPSMSPDQVLTVTPPSQDAPPAVPPPIQVPEPKFPVINAPRAFGDKVAQLIEQGNQYWRDRQWERALRTYREAQRLDPACAEAHNGMGGVFSHQGNWSQAEMAFRRAYQLASDNYTYAGHIAISLWKQNKNLPEAEQWIRRALQLKPDHADLHYQLGVIKMYQGQWLPAEAAYRQAISMNVGKGAYHADLAEVLLEQGRMIEARQAATQARVLGQTEHRVYARLEKTPPNQAGIIPPSGQGEPDQRRWGELLWSNQLDAAFEEARRLSQQFPHHPTVGVGRIGLEIFFGHMESARKTAEDLLRLHPSNPYVLIARGQVAYWEDTPDQVTMRQMFNRAMTIDPNIGGAYYNQAIQFFNRKVYGIAYQQFATVVALSPQQMWMSRYYLGVTAEYLGDTEDAIQQYQAFLKQSVPPEWTAAAQASLQRLQQP